MSSPSGAARVFKRGDQVEATVVEIVDEREFIIRYDGDREDLQSRLLRIKNESRRTWKIGDRVWLRVLEILPLKFQLIEPLNEQRRRGRLDVSV
jgi:hypothetical protein